MIKVQNSIATREPIPAFLQGLAAESLADLSWTDPALGVSDAAWWPEEDASPALQQFERYGAETLTPDAERQVVTVVREVEPWTQAEIDAHVAEQAAQASAANEAQAKRLLQESDWSDLPSVRNTTITPHLVNGEDFDAYRAALRSIVVDKPATVQSWPVRPDAVWSTQE